MEKRNLIFIYNADSDIFSGIKDSVAKVLTGKSQCSLCTATWNSFTKKQSWLEKERGLKASHSYYHRDNMPGSVKKFIDDKKIKLPTVLTADRDNFAQIITRRQLDKCSGDDDCVWILLKSRGFA